MSGLTQTRMPRRAWLAFAMTAAAVPLVLSGCTTARNDLGTTSSQCFRALPVARAAVDEHGSYAGTVLVSVSSLSEKRPLRHLVERLDPTAKSLCLVAYKGNFTRSLIDDAVGKAPPGGVGRYAIVVVTSPQNKLLGTAIFESEPVRFRHLLIGA